MKSLILKFLSNEEQEALKSKLEVGEGDIVFFAGSWESSCNILGRIRLESATLLEKGDRLYAILRLEISWVVDFPLMHFEEDEGDMLPHHPFATPVEEDLSLLESEPKKVRGQHYDIVLNGVELGGALFVSINQIYKRKFLKMC